MADVSLSAAVRDSLLSLRSTTDLIQRTQNRLSSGLRVAGPVDDPVAYFSAKALNDRAFDFTEKKDGIGQGISTVTAALDGVDAVEQTVRQLKGIANNMKSASSTQLSDLITQFNDLRTQINNLASDASYQGTNLIAGTGQTLSVEFSEKTAARLDVASVDLTVASGGLAVDTVALQTTAFNVNYGSQGNTYSAVSGGDNLHNGISAGSTLVFTWNGANDTTYGTGQNITFAYGDNALTVNFRDAVTYDNGDLITVDLTTAAATAGEYIIADTKLNFSYSHACGTSAASTEEFCGGETFTALTYQGPTHTFTTADNGIQISVGDTTVVLHVLSGDSFALTAGTQFDFISLSGATAYTTVTAGTFYTTAGTTGVVTALATGDSAVAATHEYGINFGASGATATFSTVDSAVASRTNFVAVGDTAQIDTVIDELDAALTTLRSQAQVLGTNVALLNTRLDFTSAYVNTLEGGSGKLTLADINTEGANLLALQTRQQLGISALSFAGQAEQSILALFR